MKPLGGQAGVAELGPRASGGERGTGRRGRRSCRVCLGGRSPALEEAAWLDERREEAWAGQLGPLFQGAWKEKS